MKPDVRSNSVVIRGPRLWTRWPGSEHPWGSLGKLLRLLIDQFLPLLSRDDNTRIYLIVLS